MADKNHLHRATTTRVVYVANFFLFLFLFCQKSFKNSTSIALDTLNKMIMKLIQFKKNLISKIKNITTTTKGCLWIMSKFCRSSMAALSLTRCCWQKLDEQAKQAKYIFPSNHNIHKSWCGLCFWAPYLLIDRYYKNLSMKGFAAQIRRPRELLWMLWFNSLSSRLSYGEIKILWKESDESSHPK